MITVRARGDRGRAKTGWLDSRHTFSFGHYQDPTQMGFRALRVINEDRVIPGAGFPPHGHENMEIISYVLDGALEHKDTTGTNAVIRPREVQRMSAGTGIRHSEFNHSKEAPVHFLQIWILPEKDGLPPGYEQRAFPAADGKGKFQLVAARDGRAGSVTVHQDVDLHRAILDDGQSVRFELKPGRFGWVQVARGQLRLNGTELFEGDGAAIGNEKTIEISATSDAEVLLFDLA
jgi:hypothetical protein